jgi:hypothetical protein
MHVNVLDFMFSLTSVVGAQHLGVRPAAFLENACPGDFRLRGAATYTRICDRTASGLPLCTVPRRSLEVLAKFWQISRKVLP